MKAKTNQLLLILLITLAAMMFGYTLYAQNASSLYAPTLWQKNLSRKTMSNKILLSENKNTLQQEKPLQ